MAQAVSHYPQKSSSARPAAMEKPASASLPFGKRQGPIGGKARPGKPRTKWKGRKTKEAGAVARAGAQAADAGMVF